VTSSNHTSRQSAKCRSRSSGARLRFASTLTNHASAPEMKATPSREDPGSIPIVMLVTGRFAFPTCQFLDAAAEACFFLSAASSVFSFANFPAAIVPL